MPLDELESAAMVADLWPEWLENREKSTEWQRWALGKQQLPWVPDTASLEYKALQEKSITPWLGLVVQAMVDALFVEGYRTSGSADDNRLWSVWQANQMDEKQSSIYDAAFTTGIAYNAVLPTEMPGARRTPKVDGAAVPEWRPYSSAEMSAFYDAAYDLWPTYALAGERAPKWKQQQGQPTRWHVYLIDDEAVYVFEYDGAGHPVHVATREHGVGRCPVVRYVNRMTITGRVLGEVEPYTAVASRIDQDVFDRLVVQREAAWRVRTATGLVFPDPPAGLTDEEREQFEHDQEITLKMGGLLTSPNPDTKFGSLPETRMDPYLAAPTEDIRHLSAVSQTPPTHLTGDLANISAEALAALEAAHNRKVEKRKTNFGEAHEQCFALSAEIMGEEVDEGAQVRWRDMESRSMGQLSDSLGKLAQMLEIPVEVLWDKVPFLTDQDRARARELRAQGDAFGALVSELARGQTPAVSEPAVEPPVPVDG